MAYDAEYNSGKTLGFLVASLAGTEYETADYGIFSNSAQDQNVLCVVCYTKTRSAVIIIPGKRSCPDNKWTFEYEVMLHRNNEIIKQNYNRTVHDVFKILTRNLPNSDY